jgi:glycosyltransferase involved in cell wall biosynthesis
VKSEPDRLRNRISISVVIPAYNDAEFLNTCLRALSQQRRPADEIIVVDNASTDKTAAVAVAAGVRLLTEPSRGIWPAAATGYDAAEGTVIARLDADSVPPVDWLERIEARFRAYPGTAVYTGPGDFYDCDPLTAWFGRRVYLGGYFLWMGLWIGHYPLFGSNFAMRRDVWAAHRNRVRRHRGDVHDDLDFSMHLSRSEKVSLDRTLRVAISGRPFASPRNVARRVIWAAYTLFADWPDYAPWSIRRRAERHSPQSQRPRS